MKERYPLTNFQTIKEIAEYTNLTSNIILLESYKLFYRQNKNIRFSKLYPAYFKACKKYKVKPLSYGRFSSLVGDLELYGAIYIITTYEKSHSVMIKVKKIKPRIPSDATFNFISFLKERIDKKCL